jgi:hypothetical protein
MSNTKSNYSSATVLSSLSLLLGIISFMALDAYAVSDDDDDSFSFEGVPDVIIETADSTYAIDPDYTSFFDDVLGDVTIKNKDAKDAKNLLLERGETVRISYSGERTFVASTSVFLVDKGEKDIDIVTGNVGDRVEIGFANCDAEDCQDFEAQIPSDLDEGTYKLVIDRDEDEGHYFYINRVRIS